MSAQYHKTWRNKNKDKWQAIVDRSLSTNYVKNMLKRAKKRAKSRGMEFSIDETDIEIPDICPVLGIPLEKYVKGARGGHQNSISLDRINPDKGYVKGNVVVISKRANTIKSNATVEELEKILKWYKEALNGQTTA